MVLSENERRNFYNNFTFKSILSAFLHKILRNYPSHIAETAKCISVLIFATLKYVMTVFEHIQQVKRKTINEEARRNYSTKSLQKRSSITDSC